MLYRCVMADEPTLFNKLKSCRYGYMLYNVHDIYVGRSFDLYGEFSEGEVSAFRQLIRPGSVVVDVGANIGAHTLPFARIVGGGGAVVAIEPQRLAFQTLCANMALNSIVNVTCLHAALGPQPARMKVPVLNPWKDLNFGGLALDVAESGETVEVRTLDSIGFSRCDFIKIDAEGMERGILEGAVRTISRFRPLLYVENDRRDRSDALVRLIAASGYKLFWHEPPLYNPRNFAGNADNVFGNIVSRNMACIPVESTITITGARPVEVPA